MTDLSSDLARFILETAPKGPPPVVRGEVYRRLVRANFHAVITNAFPVTEEVIGEEALEALIAAFLDTHGATTSFFREIPGDFVAWIDETGHEYADLMQYEWLDLLAQRHPADLDALANEPRADDLLRPNPTMQIGVYQRPVHLISPEDPSPEPFPTEMAYLIWRRPKTDETAFHRAGLLIARALALLSVEPMTLDALADRIAGDAPGISVETIARALTDLSSDLRARDGLL